MDKKNVTKKIIGFSRIVVHWRYAPVCAYDNTWRPNPKAGWECWIDEYYYIYPDAAAIRRATWKKGTLGQPRQFQESLALLHPEQKISDLLEKDSKSMKLGLIISLMG